MAGWREEFSSEVFQGGRFDSAFPVRVVVVVEGQEAPQGQTLREKLDNLLL